MNSHTASQLPPWGLDPILRRAPAASSRVDGHRIRESRPAVGARTTPRSSLVQRLVVWLLDPSSQTYDARVVARRMEHASPGFAAELRTLAMRRTDNVNQE